MNKVSVEQQKLISGGRTFSCNGAEYTKGSQKVKCYFSTTDYTKYVIHCVFIHHYHG